MVAVGRVAIHKSMKRRSKIESQKNDLDSLDSRSRLESVGDDNVFPVEEKSKPEEEVIEDLEAAGLK